MCEEQREGRLPNSLLAEREALPQKKVKVRLRLRIPQYDLVSFRLSTSTYALVS
jgi:hypothetical protein